MFLKLEQKLGQARLSTIKKVSQIALVGLMGFGLYGCGEFTNQFTTDTDSSYEKWSEAGQESSYLKGETEKDTGTEDDVFGDSLEDISITLISKNKEYWRALTNGGRTKLISEALEPYNLSCLGYESDENGYNFALRGVDGDKDVWWIFSFDNEFRLDSLPDLNPPMEYDEESKKRIDNSNVKACPGLSESGEIVVSEQAGREDDTETLAPIIEPNYDALFEELQTALINQDMDTIGDFIGLPNDLYFFRHDELVFSTQDSKEPVVNALRDQLNLCEPRQQPLGVHRGEIYSSLVLDCGDPMAFWFGIERIDDRPYIVDSLHASTFEDYVFYGLFEVIIEKFEKKDIETLIDFFNIPFYSDYVCGHEDISDPLDIITSKEQLLTHLDEKVERCGPFNAWYHEEGYRTIATPCENLPVCFGKDDCEPEELWYYPDVYNLDDVDGVLLIVDSCFPAD